MSKYIIVKYTRSENKYKDACDIWYLMRSLYSEFQTMVESSCGNDRTENDEPSHANLNNVNLIYKYGIEHGTKIA